VSRRSEIQALSGRDIARLLRETGDPAYARALEAEQRRRGKLPIARSFMTAIIVSALLVAGICYIGLLVLVK
jgi:hypothetical protein